MTEPKLLTEAEWRERINASEHFTELAIAALKKDGLVARDPADPDLLEAREIVAHAYNLTQRCFENNHPAVVSTLAGIKRGKELAQPKPLTWEMVATSLRSLFVNSDGVSYATDAMMVDAANRVHTALVEQMK